MILRRSASALPRPDFVARPPSHRRLAVLVGLAALAVLAGTLLDGLDLRRQIDTARAEQSRWEAQRIRLLAESARREPPALPDEWRRKAWRVGDALHFPWGGVLAALEARSRPGLRWIALELDRERGSFRLEGIAADPAAALATADAIAAAPGFGDVVMARLAALDGTTGQRFEVSGRVDTGTLPAPERSP